MARLMFIVLDLIAVIAQGVQIDEIKNVCVVTKCLKVDG
jgi:hypothetical protein